MILVEFDFKKSDSDSLYNPETNSAITSVDVNNANILIDIINKESKMTSVWNEKEETEEEKWIFETDVYEWPRECYNFTPILIEEFIIKTSHQHKQHYTRIALFQVHGTLFYWGRIYEDKNFIEGVWNFKNFQYFKLGFRKDVERFIDQYLKLFSTSDQPVHCTYIRPFKPPADVTLNQNTKENRPCPRSGRSRKEPSRVHQSLTARHEKKENKPRVPRLSTGRKRGPYKKSSKDSNLNISVYDEHLQLMTFFQNKTCTSSPKEKDSSVNEANVHQTPNEVTTFSTNECLSVQQSCLCPTPTVNYSYSQSSQKFSRENQEVAREIQTSQVPVDKINEVPPYCKQEDKMCSSRNFLESQNLNCIQEESNLYTPCDVETYINYRKNTSPPGLSRKHNPPQLINRFQEFQQVENQPQFTQEQKTLGYKAPDFSQEYQKLEYQSHFFQEQISEIEAPGFPQQFPKVPSEMELGNVAPGFPQQFPSVPSKKELEKIAPSFPQQFPRVHSEMEPGNVAPGFLQQFPKVPSKKEPGNVAPGFPQQFPRVPYKIEPGNVAPGFPQQFPRLPSNMEPGNIDSGFPQQFPRVPSDIEPGNIDPNFSSMQILQHFTSHSRDDVKVASSSSHSITQSLDMLYSARNYYDDNSQASSCSPDLSFVYRSKSLDYSFENTSQHSSESLVKPSPQEHIDNLYRSKYLHCSAQNTFYTFEELISSYTQDKLHNIKTATPSDRTDGTSEIPYKVPSRSEFISSIENVGFSRGRRLNFSPHLGESFQQTSSWYLPPEISSGDDSTFDVIQT